MESLTNTTFEEIRIGSTTTVSRTLNTTELEALALAGGDVDGFEIAKGEESRVR